MAIHIYRRRGSTGAFRLAKELECVRIRDINRAKFKPNDVLICWGEADPGVGIKTLNGAPIRSKLTDALILIKAKVPTIEISKVAVPGWLARSTYHTGGTDLLNPGRKKVGFWTKKEEFVKEIRIHSFGGRSIRAGVKALRKEFSLDGAKGTQKAHPWVRSWDGGWRIVYDGVTAQQKHRDVAHAAVKALDLHFGAVDIGERADGSLCVLEVNRAPGVEGGTVKRYADAIRGWVNG